MRRFLLVLVFFVSLLATARGQPAACTISGTFYKANGQPAAGAVLQTATADSADHLIEQSAIVIRADSLGQVSLDLHELFLKLGGPE